MKSAVYVAWEESERGWGVRPDGCSLHLTERDFEDYEKHYWAGMPNSVPDEYSRPCSEPRIVLVKDSLYKKIQKTENGLRLWQSETGSLINKKDITLRL